jgi:hypothetical protein
MIYHLFIGLGRPQDLKIDPMSLPVKLICLWSVSQLQLRPSSVLLPFCALCPHCGNRHMVVSKERNLFFKVLFMEFRCILEVSNLL